MNKELSEDFTIRLEDILSSPARRQFQSFSSDKISTLGELLSLGDGQTSLASRYATRICSVCGGKLQSSSAEGSLQELLQQRDWQKGHLCLSARTVQGAASDILKELFSVRYVVRQDLLLKLEGDVVSTDEVLVYGIFSCPFLDSERARCLQIVSELRKYSCKEISLWHYETRKGTGESVLRFSEGWYCQSCNKFIGSGDRPAEEFLGIRWDSSAEIMVGDLVEAFSKQDIRQKDIQEAGSELLRLRERLYALQGLGFGSYKMGHPLLAMSDGERVKLFLVELCLTGISDISISLGNCLKLFAEKERRAVLTFLSKEFFLKRIRLEYDSIPNGNKSFNYLTEKSFTDIPAGENLCITGPAGSGKTGILKKELPARIKAKELDYRTALYFGVSEALSHKGTIGSVSGVDQIMAEYFSSLPEAAVKGLKAKDFAAEKPTGILFEGREINEYFSLFIEELQEVFPYIESLSSFCEFGLKKYRIDTAISELPAGRRLLMLLASEVIKQSQKKRSSPFLLLVDNIGPFLSGTEIKDLDKICKFVHSGEGSVVFADNTAGVKSLCVLCV